MFHAPGGGGGVNISSQQRASLVSMGDGISPFVPFEKKNGKKPHQVVGWGEKKKKNETIYHSGGLAVSSL